VDLVNGREEAGRHEVIWEGRSSTGRDMPAGAYFVRLERDLKVKTRKILMVR